jgi:DNA topoisomerase-1
MLHSSGSAACAHAEDQLLLEIKQRVEEELRDELSGLRPEEAAVLVFLQRRLARTLKDKLCESLAMLQRKASAPQRKKKSKRLAAAAA